jgi:HEPN domain-containing protein
MSGSENWLRFAREDIRMADMAMAEGMYNQFCFHSQQCAEKGLKAWLAQTEESIPRTHRMADLISLMPEDIIGEMADPLLLLDQFYIPTRYPDALPGSLPDSLPDKKDAKEALKTAQKLLKIIEKKLTT